MSDLNVFNSENEFSLWMNSETSEGKEKSSWKRKLQLVPWDLTSLCTCMLNHFGRKLFCIYCAGEELFIVGARRLLLLEGC